MNRGKQRRDFRDEQERVESSRCVWVGRVLAGHGAVADMCV